MALFSPAYEKIPMSNTSKHRVWSPKHRLVRNIPETFKGLGLFQQLCLLSPKGDACRYSLSGAYIKFANIKNIL